MLRVVGAQTTAGPARLGDEVFQQEDVVAQMRRLAQLVREREIARDEIHLLVLVLQRLAEGVQVPVTGDDEPHLDLGPVLVEQLHRARDEDRVGPAFEQPAAHTLRHRDRLDAGELERHEQRLVLHRDLLSEDRELHADWPELRGFLQDRLQDRKRRRQRAGRVLAKGVVDVLPVNEESDVRQCVSPYGLRTPPDPSADPLESHALEVAHPRPHRTGLPLRFGRERVIHE